MNKKIIENLLFYGSIIALIVCLHFIMQSEIENGYSFIEKGNLDETT
jgi:hypothetical protein